MVDVERLISKNRSTTTLGKSRPQLVEFYLSQQSLKEPYNACRAGMVPHS